MEDEKTTDFEVFKQLKSDAEFLEHLKFHVYTSTLAIVFIEKMELKEKFKEWSKKYNNIIQDII